MTVRDFKTAMILAAGRGERMQPLTSVLPKPALPMTDGPVVASALRLAASAGATRIVVNVSHLAEKMAAAVSEVTVGGIEISLSIEEELMGTAGGLALARERGLLGNESSVLVINGDGALGLSLEGFAENHISRGDLVTLALLPHLDPQRWSRVVLDVDEMVTEIHPRGRPGPLEVPYVYPGVMAIHREALDALPAAPGEIPLALWNPARKARRLGGIVVAGHWREIGTPNDYLEVMLRRLAGASWVHPSAVVSGSASIRNSFVGRGADISDRAVVTESVVAEGVRVGNGALVNRSVLLGGFDVVANEKVIGEFRATPR